MIVPISPWVSSWTDTSAAMWKLVKCLGAFNLTEATEFIEATMRGNSDSVL